MMTRGARSCVRNTATGLPDWTTSVSSAPSAVSDRTMPSNAAQLRAALPVPPYTTRSSGRSATSGSRLFWSIRKAASCGHPRHDSSEPRGARTGRAPRRVAGSSSAGLPPRAACASSLALPSARWVRSPRGSLTTSLFHNGPVSLVALNGSHSASSTTHAVATLAAETYGSGDIVDLVTLDPAGLIGGAPSPDVAGLLAAIAEASILVLVTPIYRATYSGLLKVVFDQLPGSALKGKAAVLAATAGAPPHYLALNTGLRSLVASLDGWTVPTVTYATPADFDEDKRPSENVRVYVAMGLRAERERD